MGSNERYIMERVSQHRQAAWDYIEEKGGYIIGTFLHGSQNYNLDTAESDVDTISIYVPSVDFAIVNSPKNHQLIMEDGSNEHCTIKDIRNYVNELLKSNLNAIELLYTKYSFYLPEFKYFLNNREKFLIYNTSSLLDAADGLAYAYLKRCNEKGVRNFYRIAIMLTNISNEKFSNPYLLTDNERNDVFKAASAVKDYGEFFGAMKDYISDRFDSNNLMMEGTYNKEAFKNEINKYMIKLVKES